MNPNCGICKYVYQYEVITPCLPSGGLLLHGVLRVKALWAVVRLLHRLLLCRPSATAASAKHVLHELFGEVLRVAHSTGLAGDNISTG